MEEKLYKEGVDLMNAGRYDEARGKLEQAQRLTLKSPKYRTQIARYLKEMDDRDREEKLYQEGVRLMNDGKDAEARRRFEEVIQLGGAHSADARTNLKQLEERTKAAGAAAAVAQAEESAFNSAVSAFNSGDYSTARSRFQDVAAMNGKRRADAERYLGNIETALKSRQEEDNAFQDAVRKFDRKDWAGARLAFRLVSGMNGTHKGEADRYLQRVEEAAKAEEALKKQVEAAKQTGESPQQAVARLLNDARGALGAKDYAQAIEKLRVAEALDPSNRTIKSLLDQATEMESEQTLRAGLQAFFDGKWDDAEKQLSAYLERTAASAAWPTSSAAPLTAPATSLRRRNPAQGAGPGRLPRRAIQPAQLQAPSATSPKILDLYRASQ
jgi:tetratricopeptide (TPR) repeat protein